MTSPPTSPIAIVGDGYVAGACNIGAYEIRRRRLFGFVGIAIGVVLAVVLLAIGAPAWTRLLLLFPFWGGVFSLLQARRRFCAAFALAGVANFADDDAGRRHVADDAAHLADMTAVARMTRDSFIAGALIAVVVALLPF